MTSAVQRGLWRLVRRRRCERALCAIHDGRADDAHRALTHVGAAGDRRVEALTAVATALAAGSLSAATGCIAVLENASPDPETCAAAGEVLAPVLWVGAGCPPESVPRIARLTDRLMRVTGSLPWGHYNLAVHALQVGDHRAVENYLAAAAAPSGGWPLPLLDAAYAAIVGDAALLARSLAAPRVHPVDADDHRFLTGVDEVFACLRTDRRVDAARLGAAFGSPTGALTDTVPTLSALKLVLASVVGGERLRHNGLDLGRCTWGRWVRDRLRFASDEADDVLAMSNSDASPLAWQQFGARQDLRALLPDAMARELRPRLLEMRDTVAGNAFWGRLVEQRVHLGEAPAVDNSAPESEIGTCPWWPTDGVLQTTARREAEIEIGYLDGRRALRDGHHEDALRRFAAARAQLSGQGMATRLVDLRFGPLLRYWEGVTIAHLGRDELAERSLRACEYGVMAREARAQLGLLAVAVGDDVEAAHLLATITAPRPPAADYLAAVIAAREGATDEVIRLVDGLVSRESVADAYVAAGHRLRGRVHELSGEFAAADRDYRHALSRCPTDPVAAVRLARVWLRRRYDDADLPSDPLLDRGWIAVSAVGWAAPLVQVRDCVTDMPPASARHLLDRLPADPDLYLLTVRSAVAAGASDAAATALRAWRDTVTEPDARLVHASRIARAAGLLREFCAVDGHGPARQAVEDMVDELAADPRLAFWAEAVRRLHDHESAATAPPIDVDGSPSTSARLFAALLSVFSADGEQRRAGALACRTALAGKDLVLEGPARAMVRCLAADALGDDAALLAAYREIETDTDALPCDTAAAFLAATEARLRVGDLDAVIDGVIPAGLADLADPRVRRAMGVAYARRAARTSDRDPRAALRDLDQACDHLGGDDVTVDDSGLDEQVDAGLARVFGDTSPLVAEAAESSCALVEPVHVLACFARRDGSILHAELRRRRVDPESFCHLVYKAALGEGRVPGMPVGIGVDALSEATRRMFEAVEHSTAPPNDGEGPFLAVLLDHVPPEAVELLTAIIGSEREFADLVDGWRRTGRSQQAVELLDPDTGLLRIEAFDVRGRRVLTVLREEVAALGYDKATALHLLYALVGINGGVLQTALQFQGVDPLREVHSALALALRRPVARRAEPAELGRETLHESVRGVLERAVTEASRDGVSTGEIHVAREVVATDRGVVVDWLGGRGLDVERLREHLRHAEPADESDSPELLVPVSEIGDRLRERILGQDHAIARVLPWIKRLRFGFPRERGPAAVLLFLGPSGCGKTELAKELARTVYGSDEHMLMLEMGQFATKESGSLFIGAPPGFVGYGEGKLTNGLRDRPHGVVLFDELEKAHEEVWPALMRFLDEGVIDDPAGPTRDGRGCVVVLTSNLGADTLATLSPVSLAGPPVDDRPDAATEEAIRNEVLRYLKRPEIYNRVDDKVVFQAFDEGTYRRLVERQVALEVAKFGERGTHVDVMPDVYDWLTGRAVAGRLEGARCVPRLTNHHVVSPVIDVLTLDDEPAAEVTVSVRGDRTCAERS